MSNKQIVYLVQGRKRNVVQYYYLQNNTSDLITVTFDELVSEDELPSKKNIFFPDSTWAEGRNLQLSLVMSLEQKYLYYIFIDDDVEFERGTFAEFEKLLILHKPAVAVPLLSIFKQTYRYDPNLTIQHPVGVDQQFQAYHRKVLDEGLVMPLITEYDKLSWFYSCEINNFMILRYYSGQVMQFNNIHVANVGHGWDPLTNSSIYSKSKYVGGISREGLDLCRKWIEDRFGKQPEIVNSLFHRSNVPLLPDMPQGRWFIKQLIKGLLEKQYKQVYEMIRLKIIYLYIFTRYFGYISNYKINTKKVRPFF